MNLEYLVVGIAKGNEEDFKEFFDATNKGAFAFALVLTGDRLTAREAAAESYRRVVSEAKNFDTSMSARVWHLELVRNLCLNGLADGEIARQASSKRRENLSILLSAAMFGTSEDRGKIITARLGADLSKYDAARLLWYNAASCAGEYKRGLKEAAGIAGYKGDDAKTAGELEQALREDFASAVPDYFELAKGAKETMFAKINGTMLVSGESEAALPGESREARQERLAGETVASSKRKVIITVCVIAAILAVAAVSLSIFFAIHSRTVLEEPDDNTYEIEEPQYKTVASCLIADGKIFYSDYSDNDALYVRDIAEGTARKLSDAVPRDFSTVSGGLCYFRDASKGELCSLNIKTFEIESLGVKGALPCVSGGDIFYSSKAGVSKLSGGTITDIFVDNTGGVFCFDMAVIGDTVVFSSPSSGLFRLTPTETGEYYCDNSMSGSQINYFDVSGKYIVFDDGIGDLYILDMDTGRLLPRIKADLMTGAFCVYGETVYFYGKTDADGKGIYSITISDAAAEMAPAFLFSNNNKYDVSDIYVCEDVFLLYYSNGAKNDNAYNELVLRKGDGKEETVFKK
ncbi:MAG: hypothetical protein J6112_10225 [Clostridia bacterium]|nr:hypothetical protein [Clostridia bacterium]